MKSGAMSPTRSVPPRAAFHIGSNGTIIMAGIGKCRMIRPNRCGGWRITTNIAQRNTAYATPSAAADRPTIRQIRRALTRHSIRFYRPPTVLKTSPRSQKRAGLAERQSRQSRVQRRGIAVPEIAQEIRFDVSLRKKFLIARDTGLPGGKELFVDLHLIEAGHRSAIEAQRAGRHHHVRALQ